MSNQKLKTLLISDFTVDQFAGFLKNDQTKPFVTTTIAPYGQVIPILLNENAECWQGDHDVIIVWTQPDQIIKTFQRAVNFERIPIESILAEVDSFCQALLSIQKRATSVFVPMWVVPSYHRGYGVLDMKSDVGLSNILMQMNLRLSENLEDSSNIYVLNTQRWIQTIGKNSFSPKLWYMGKIPFDPAVFKEATNNIKVALRGVLGLSKKVIIVDLDDTLWGGIVGEVGWQNLRLGGHDPIGEAFVDFQKTLKSLKQRGIILGIVSKNEESVALEAIEKHPEMILTLEDFAGWKINWDDKAKNIVELVGDFNLGLQSVVYIDDHPAERDRIKKTLPEVYVPQWPEDKMLYKQELLKLPCFDTPAVSAEDKKRTEMYHIERKRQQIKADIGSLEDWVKTLYIKVNAEELNHVNVQRTAQLLNKTNQMNLTTRRMTEDQLKEWAEEDNRKLWTLRVTDKFGDYGLTGIVSVEWERDKAHIVDFVLSCRVIGRKIEETMIYLVYDLAKTLELEEISAQFIPTEKNKPCLQFFKNSGFDFNEENNVFTLNVSKGYLKPQEISLTPAKTAENKTYAV